MMNSFSMHLKNEMEKKKRNQFSFPDNNNLPFRGWVCILQQDMIVSIYLRIFHITSVFFFSSTEQFEAIHSFIHSI